MRHFVGTPVAGAGMDGAVDAATFATLTVAELLAVVLIKHRRHQRGAIMVDGAAMLHACRTAGSPAIRASGLCNKTYCSSQIHAFVSR